MDCIPIVMQIHMQEQAIPVLMSFQAFMHLCVCTNVCGFDYSSESVM